MKQTISNAKKILFVLAYFLFGSLIISGQEGQSLPDRPVRNMFESIWLIDNQTVVVPFQGTFEFDIQHRFGTWQNGYDDFWGLFAPSNFRLGFNYVLFPKFQTGFGFAKDNLVWDFHAKYAIMEQSRSGAKPFSMTYLVNAAIDTRDMEKTIFNQTGDRFSYFHQLMVARKISDKLSLQASGNFVHFNFVDAILDDNGDVVPKRENDHFALSFLGRFKINPGTALIANIDLPLTDHQIDSPESNISFGIENVTSSHAFQIFIGNFKSLVPQYNHFYNLNDFGDNEILIGFNMTRLWNF